MLELARDGSEQAFEALHSRYQDTALGFLRRMIGPNDAEDLTQVTFLKVHKNIQTLDPSRPFKPWLLKIAYNTALDFFRKGKEQDKATQPITSEGTVAEYESAAPLPDRIAEIREYWSQALGEMENWLQAYTDPEGGKQLREALKLYLGDGYHKDWSGIARTCGYKNGNSARSAVHKGVKRALSSPDAFREAQRIMAQLDRNARSLGLGLTIRHFLGIVDLTRIEQYHEESS